MDDLALEFVAETRAELFPETPGRLLFEFAGEPTPAELDGRRSRVWTSAARWRWPPRCSPTSGNVFVVTGVGRATRDIRAVARAQFRPFESRLDLHLSDRDCDANELERAWRRCRAHSIVYYLVVDRDGAGENFHPLEYLDRVVAALERADLLLGGLGDGPWHRRRQPQEPAGGDRRPRQAGAARPSRRAADSIPWSSPDLNVRQVDWRQLQRWGISEARVPPGRSSSSGSLRSGIATAATLPARRASLLAQTALIAALLVQRARRRRAEEHLRGSQCNCARATIAFAISASACSTRRRTSARGSRASCTTTSGSRWRCWRSISSCMNAHGHQRAR